MEVRKLRSDVGSVKNTVETMNLKIEAMKVVLILPIVVGLILTPTAATEKKQNKRFLILKLSQD